MPLINGTRFDHYEILSHVGAGNMGEVYRARDTKLSRDVAFKILPAEFVSDPERLLRFQREAQLLASLNHPNIAQIYGVVDAVNARGIVMEFVQGETLQARLKRGAIAMDEAVSIAIQVAEAVQAAHDRGVIHRDLKPSNIMVDADGKVKVLDFGLAKALDTPGEGDVANSPTLITALPSSAHVLIGTAAYMSPEQVRGRAAGYWSDMWAFGCVLFEILTGRAAFAGDTVADLIGAIVRTEPDWDALPSNTPPALIAVLKRCLQKDRHLRYHAIGDVRLDLQEMRNPSLQGVATRPRRRERLAHAVLGAVLGIAAAGLIFGIVFSRQPSVEIVSSRFSIDLPSDRIPFGAVVATPYPAISPNGRYVVFVLQGASAQQLWLRPIDSLAAQVIAGTEGSTAYPFWSPNSQYIGFFAGGKLKKVSVAGGAPQVLCDADGGGGTWNDDDMILFEKGGSIHRVSAAGGISSAIRTPEKSKNETAYKWPSFLPDGKTFVYLAVGTAAQNSQARVGHLDSPNDQPLLAMNSRVLYSPPGHLLFVKNGTLMAQPFDERRLALAGDAFPLVERVATDDQILSGNAAFSVSSTGTLIYRATNTNPATELTWFDRAGKKLRVEEGNSRSTEPFLSPDQNRVAVARRDSGQSDIWIIDLLRGTNSRVTSDSSDDTYPVFSGDGRKIIYLSNRDGTFGLYAKDSTGGGFDELVQQVQGTNDHPNDWSADGKTLVYVVNGDLWARSMTDERKSYPILNQSFNERRARLSPDGRWMVYTSNETGRPEVYVQTFPPSGTKLQLSVDGAGYGHWARGGREILFDGPRGRILAVDIKLGTIAEAGTPHELFQVPGAIVGGRWDVTPNGERFIFPLASQTSGTVALTAILNWHASIKK